MCIFSKSAWSLAFLKSYSFFHKYLVPSCQYLCLCCFACNFFSIKLRLCSFASSFFGITLLPCSISLCLCSFVCSSFNM